MPGTTRLLAIFGAFVLSACSGRSDTSHLTGRDLALPDATLHYEIMGQQRGIPLIAINGGPGFDHKVMLHSEAWNELGAKRQIIFYDQRGTGRSSSRAPVRQITVRQLVWDLEQLRRHLGAQRVDLVGWSWGAYLAMAYAAEHPAQVAHLVTVGGPPPDLTRNLYLFDAVYPEVTATIPESTPGCAAESIPKYVRSMFYDPRNRVEFERETRGGFYSEAMCDAAFGDALKLDLTPAVRTMRFPVLITNGRFDTNVAPKMAFNLARTFPNARLIFFERSGHMPFVEQPHDWASKVESFLESGSGQ